MISVSSFREKDLRIWKMHKITNNFIKNRGSKMHKITNNFIKNRGSNLMLNKSGRGQPKKHPHQICNKSVQWFDRRNQQWDIT